MVVDNLWAGQESAHVTLLLAHGAGAAMDSAGMNDLADVIRLMRRGA